MELIELVRQGQDALDRGDYGVATAAGRHILETYPTCLSAHRMLGEAYLEEGELDLAVTHFERSQALDPLNVVAQIGLGVAAEERQDLVTAYTYYQRAWDLNPALDPLRDELVRLREALGASGKLHPTRVGLAGIYTHNGQLGRAVAEWRAVLAAEPESQQVRTALASVLWQQGDDAAVLSLCREMLRGGSENARALALLADVERRRGLGSAEATAERYRTVDPNGVIATSLAEERADADLSFLLRESAPIADVGATEPVVPAPPHSEPAVATAVTASVEEPAMPDLWDSLVRDLHDGPSLDAVGSQANGTFDLAEFGHRLDVAVVEPGLALTPVPEPMSAPVPAAAPAHMPIEAVGADPFVTADGGLDLTAGWDELDRTLAAAVPSDAAINGYEDLVAQLDEHGLAPFAVAGDGGDEQAWAPLTADDLLVEATAMTDLATAIPGQQPSGYTELFRNRDSDVLDPFAGETDAVDASLANPDAVGDPPDFAALLDVGSHGEEFPGLEPFAVAGLEPVAGDGEVEDEVNFDDVEEDDPTAWPTFVSATSLLIGRESEGNGLFGRVRLEKTALVEAGAIVVDRSLNGRRRRRSARSDHVDELKSDGGADAGGLAAPVVRHVLGEAYVKLGRGEQASGHAGGR